MKEQAKAEWIQKDHVYYFNSVNGETKDKIIEQWKGDDFIAELALFITNGDIDKSKHFLHS